MGVSNAKRISDQRQTERLPAPHRSAILWTAIGWLARADRDHLRVIFTQTGDRTESRE